MSDVIHGNTQLSATKQDLITALVQKELKQAAILFPLFTDVSNFAVKGAKSISFPSVGSFTVTERASGAAGDASVVSTTAAKLDLNIPAYIAYIIDSNDAVQTTLEFESVAAQRAGAAHGRYVDTKILAALNSNAGFSLTPATIKDLVLDCRERIVGNHGVLQDAVLVIGTDLEKEMLKQDDFVSADKYGSSAIPSGVMGRIYGLNVVVHTGVDALTAFCAAKESLVVGFQLAPNMSSQGANQYGSGAQRVAVDQLFGVAAQYINAGDKFTPTATKSGLIVKAVLTPAGG